MTYRELFYKATRLIINNKITLGEYDEMTKPLDREVEQEPKTGHWKPYLKEGLRYQCSACDSRFDTPWEYCPHCGTKMEDHI